MGLLILAAILVAVLSWTLREALFRGWRRARIRARPFPHAWREVLRRRVPYVRSLPADLQLQLKKHIQVFLAEKPFVGCDGLEITDEMRVTIAAQACLLLLNRRTDYFPNLTEILVYPGKFIVDRQVADGIGLARRDRSVLSGESWSSGQVILSWDDALEGAARSDDAFNVVIHEFAHQLDQENGAANGAPFMRGRSRRQRWADVLGREYAALQGRIVDGQPSLIDAYGATNPAEFFAVVSEVFFERPCELAAEHPGLYAEFSRFYRVNPLSW
ncbi:MAG TPA: M90 family metallopeptidase [Burkholderiaceae bacterium]|nr:M90 family metallopeptidase [Burkholderiaceae bacterium]